LERIVQDHRVIFFRSDEEPRLERVLECAWDLLEVGVVNRHHGFHTPTLATIDSDGAPDARKIVLRQAGRADRMLRFHSDARSEKAKQLIAEPRIALTFYDPAEQTQLRIGARARLHRRGGFADAAWAAISPMSRRCYLAEQASGQAVDWPLSSLPDSLSDRRPSLAESEGDGRISWRSSVGRTSWNGSTSPPRETAARAFRGMRRAVSRWTG